MVNLGDVLGTLMASLVRARQVADEATAATAEQYRRDPLLEGLSVARVRIPDLTVEVPVLLGGHDAGEPAVPNPPETVAAEVVKALGAEAADVRLPPGFSALMAARLRTVLAAGPRRARGRASREALRDSLAPPTREVVVRAVERVVLELLRTSAAAGLTRERQAALVSVARDKAFEVAILKPARPPSLSASVVTSEVKEQADPASVTRITVTLREEGLEWTRLPAPDGSTRRRLVPE